MVIYVEKREGERQTRERGKREENKVLQHLENRTVSGNSEVEWNNHLGRENRIFFFTEGK